VWDIGGGEHWQGCGEARAQEAVVEAREEQRDAKAEPSDAIAEAARQTLDQTVQTQAAQLIGPAPWEIASGSRPDKTAR